MTNLTEPSRTVASASSPRSGTNGNFYLGMALVIVLVTVAGFGPGVNARLIHTPSPRPPILYLHAALFTAWILLFLTQAALVRARRIARHRRLGLAGVAVGGLMPIVGFATALAMTRLHRAGNDTSGESFLIVSFFDMFAFGLTFGLAVYWRRQPEYHRRLMLMASCGLTVAAFARLPNWLMPDNAWYACVDMLILAGVARDWIVMRRIHPVYRYGLPALALGQAAAMWIYLSGAPAWVVIAHALLR